MKSERRRIHAKLVHERSCVRSTCARIARRDLHPRIGKTLKCFVHGRTNARTHARARVCVRERTFPSSHPICVTRCTFYGRINEVVRTRLGGGGRRVPFFRRVLQDLKNRARVREPAASGQIKARDTVEGPRRQVGRNFRRRQSIRSARTI